MSFSIFRQFLTNDPSLRYSIVPNWHVFKLMGGVGSLPKSIGSLPEPNWFRLGSDLVRKVTRNCRQSEPSLNQLGSDRLLGRCQKFMAPALYAFPSKPHRPPAVPVAVPVRGALGGIGLFWLATLPQGGGCRLAGSAGLRRGRI